MKKSIKSALKVLTLAATLIAGSSATYAKASYRGFVDIDPALLIGNSGVDPSDFSVKTSVTDFSVLLSTTHGVQLRRNIFVGVGIGAIISNGTTSVTNNDGKDYATSYNVNYNIPVYISGRWDLNIASKVSPFVSLNLGYNINSTNTTGNASTFFVQPTAGIRIRMHHHIGLNLGLTFYSSKFKTGIHTADSTEDILCPAATYSRSNLGLNIGIDF